MCAPWPCHLLTRVTTDYAYCVFKYVHCIPSKSSLIQKHEGCNRPIARGSQAGAGSQARRAVKRQAPERVAVRAWLLCLQTRVRVHRSIWEYLEEVEKQHISPHVTLMEC